MLENPITIIWDEKVGGFTSFQTYVPDFALSLNNRYYSFKRGRIWLHNSTDTPRNTFYDGTRPSMIEVVFNDEPSTIKDFRTLGYEGTGDWDVTISTDQESTVTDFEAFPVERTVSGSVNSGEFVTREGKHFSNILGQTEDVSNLSLERISVQGLGLVRPLDNNVDAFTLRSKAPQSLRVGDEIFFFRGVRDNNDVLTHTDELNFLGTVASISGNTVTYTVSTALNFRRPGDDDFFLFSKNNVAEKSGVIGFFGIVRFSSLDTSMSELFSINTEAILSSN